MTTILWTARVAGRKSITAYIHYLLQKHQLEIVINDDIDLEREGSGA